MRNTYLLLLAFLSCFVSVQAQTNKKDVSRNYPDAEYKIKLGRLDSTRAAFNKYRENMDIGLLVDNNHANAKVVSFEFTFVISHGDFCPPKKIQGNKIPRGTICEPDGKGRLYFENIIVKAGNDTVNAGGLIFAIY